MAGYAGLYQVISNIMFDRSIGLCMEIKHCISLGEIWRTNAFPQIAFFTLRKILAMDNLGKHEQIIFYY